MKRVPPDVAELRPATPPQKRDTWSGPPLRWAYSKCGVAYITPELQPRCAVCGHREGT